MKILTPPLIVNENDGFINDALERKFFGEKLLNLVSNTNDALVISLDGKWGEGKTTFVKMWQGLLSNSNIHSIYIDAFENDYSNDAFISIMSIISDYADKHINHDDKEKLSELKSKAKDIGCRLLSWSTKVGIKAATLGIIKDSDIDELSDIKNDLSKDASNIIGKIIDDRLSSHKENIEQLVLFRKTLSEIPEKLSNSNDKPLVIIIDELDRCKPTYAVEIIEKIKHLFSVENVIFLLVMNKEQLEASIKSVYGQNIDAHTYLQKFITLETLIPKNKTKIGRNDFSKYVDHLIKIHEIETWGDNNNLADTITTLAEHFDLSLRQLEKVFSNIAICYALSAKNHLRIISLISLLSIIKVINPNLFFQLLHNKINFADLCRELRFSDISEENREHRKIFMVKCWLKYSMLPETEFIKLEKSDKAANLGSSLWEYSVDREDLIPMFSKKISMFIQN